MRKSKIVIFTGPSGVGKATIEHELFKNKNLKLRLACSATTREPRVGEKHGVHYFFISKKEFDKKILNEKFVEWNQHFSNRYGTLFSEIKKIIDDGYIPFLEIETVGAKNIIKKIGSKNVISIFVSPPSLEELKERLIERGAETNKQIVERLSKAEQELKDKSFFDHVVINNNVAETVNIITKIIGGNS